MKDVFQTIVESHEEILRLMAGVESQFLQGARPQATQTMETLMARWELEKRLEQTHVLPKLFPFAEAQFFLQSIHRSHERIDCIQQRLRLLSFEHDRWFPEFESLRDEVRDHFDEWEDRGFKKLRKFLKPAALYTLAEEAQSFLAGVSHAA